MSHFALIENNLVKQIIVAEQEFIDTLPNKDQWIQTSYNTHGGVHKLGGTPLRKNYAGIGYTYDKVRDAFIAPSPFPSWVLDEESCRYKAPVGRPLDGKNYLWDEGARNWKLDPMSNLIPQEILDVANEVLDAK